MQSGVAVGNPESRALVAQALLAAAGALTDPELLEEVAAVRSFACSASDHDVSLPQSASPLDI